MTNECCSLKKKKEKKDYRCVVGDEVIMRCSSFQGISGHSLEAQVHR